MLNAIPQQSPGTDRNGAAVKVMATLMCYWGKDPVSDHFLVYGDIKKKKKSRNTINYWATYKTILIVF